MTELIYSNARGVVSQHNYLFETLWPKAIAAESRMRELDETAPPAQTRLLKGEKEVVRQMAKMIDPSDEIVVCMTPSGVGMVLDSLAESISLAAIESSQGGLGRIRWLTCVEERDVELAEACLGLGIQVRHTSRMPPLSFVCSMSEILASIQSLGERTLFQNVLSSDDPAYVGHFRSLFKEMWEDGVDARKRIEEIHSGAELATVKVVENPHESLRIAWELIQGSKEILLMFSTPRAFLRQVNAGAFAKLKSTIGATGTSVKILIPYGEQLAPILEKAKREVPSVDFRVMNESLRTKISILIADRSKTLVLETSDDERDELFEALGMATYTESRSLAASYGAMQQIAHTLGQVGQFDCSAGILRGRTQRYQSPQPAGIDVIHFAQVKHYAIVLRHGLLHRLPQLRRLLTNTIRPLQSTITIPSFARVASFSCITLLCRGPSPHSAETTPLLHSRLTHQPTACGAVFASSGQTFASDIRHLPETCVRCRRTRHSLLLEMRRPVLYRNPSDCR